MKKNLFSGFLIAIILASLVTFPGLAREARPNPAKIAASADISPWFKDYADNHTSPHVGFYPSVAYNPDDNQPYISYYDSVGKNLVLASPAPTTGNCGTGNSWWCRVVDGINISGITGETNGDVGQYSSIAFWKGVIGILPTWKLGISYHDTTNNALKVAIWTQDPINSGWSIKTIETAV
jgi:hypothetical protein